MELFIIVGLLFASVTRADGIEFPPGNKGVYVESKKHCPVLCREKGEVWSGYLEPLPENSFRCVCSRIETMGKR